MSGTKLDPRSNQGGVEVMWSVFVNGAEVVSVAAVTPADALEAAVLQWGGEGDLIEVSRPGPDAPRLGRRA